MCDTAVVVCADRVLFAKNSDRDSNEAQLLEWQPRTAHAAGARLRCTWIEIPQQRETHAVLLSRPFWMWGAEMGANEHGVVIGNEAVFTRERVAEQGLTGMDLLRLALERTTSAKQAVEEITRLAEEFGQGGGCGHESSRFRYHSSFIVADPDGAFVLETSARRWEVEEVHGARSISNGLTIEPFASELGDRLRSGVADAGRRRACTEASARTARNVGDMMALLRDHGAGGEHPHYARRNGAMAGPCVHGGGLIASSQTTASWVAELTGDGTRHWATGTAAPCTSLFKPVRVAEPLDLGPAPTDRADAASLWWRHESLHRRVLRDPERLLPLYAAERDALEARWLEEPPEPAAAFTEADRQLAVWRDRVAAQGATDRRPGFARRHWRIRNQRAGLDIEATGR